MDVDLFVEELKKIPLSSNEYKLIGLDDNFIKSLMAGYTLKKINNLGHEIKLYEFIANYSPSNLEIGMITFSDFNALLENDDYYFFGLFDGDYLAISKSSSEVVVISSHFKEDRVAFRCANSEDKFLKSILSAGHFLERFSLIEDIDEMQEEILKASKLCADQAGGQEYLNFFKVLLGYEE